MRLGGWYAPASLGIRLPDLNPQSRERTEVRKMLNHKKREAGVSFEWNRPARKQDRGARSAAFISEEHATGFSHPYDACIADQRTVSPRKSRI